MELLNIPYNWASSLSPDTPNDAELKSILVFLLMFELFTLNNGYYRN